MNLGYLHREVSQSPSFLCVSKVEVVDVSASCRLTLILPNRASHVRAAPDFNSLVKPGDLIWCVLQNSMSE